MLKKSLLGVFVIGSLLCMVGCGKSSDEIIAELQRIDAEKKYGYVYVPEPDDREVTGNNKGGSTPSPPYETETEDKKTLWELLEELEQADDPEQGTDTTGNKTDSSDKNQPEAEYVVFGAYEQDNNPDNGKEKIEWLVLEKEYGEMLLISKYILDANHVEEFYDIWEKRPLRTWLNEEFYDEAFSEDEKSKIIKSRFENPDNEGYSVSGGATEDYVSLLSVNEARRYFGEDDSVYGNSRLFARATEYAVARGVAVNTSAGFGKGNSAWDLRSNGYHSGYVAWVSDTGTIYDGGHAQAENEGIRPIIRICYMSEEEADREIYGKALSYFEKGNYEEAEACFLKMKDTSTALDKIIECRYLWAKKLYDAGRFGEAKVLFSLVEGYKDASEMLISAEKKEIESLKVGDSYILGTYEQDNDKKTGTEPIEWQVLDIKGDRMLLISKYVLDVQAFDDNQAIWEKSSLRKWLRDDFYNSAFSAKEKNRIIETKLKNSDNYLEPDDVTADTTDTVFLLSVNEAVQYFGEDVGFENPSRTAAPTAYAIAQGVNANGSDADDLKCWWLLRSNGVHNGYVEQVNVWGQFVDINKSWEDRGVRPAIWVTLE